MSIKGPYEIVHYFVGLSTDTKPTETAVLGDRFFESDTRLWYIYDGTSWSMLNEEFSLSLYGKCSSTMTASTTELVVPTLVRYGDDFFNNKFYIQILKNANSVGNAPEIQVRKITDYVSTTGTFTVDAFGANVEASDEIVVLHESLVALGRDDNDNVFASTNVVANADGSMIERLEWIQVALGGAATQLRVQQSASGTVEETDLIRFQVSLMDIDSGAIASADIDITAITQTMERSRNGSAYSVISDPVVTFSKADGIVYMDYEFKAVQWQVGDMYRMSLSGITCTLHGDTAYVPAMIWNNIVVEAEDLTYNTQYLYGVADGGATSPTKVLDNSILSILMTKESGGDTSDFDNSTDSFEAISDKVGGFSGDGGAAQDDSVKASLDLAHTDLDTIITDTEKIYDVSLGVAPVDGSLASFLATGGTALGTRLPASTSLYDTTKNISTIGVTGAPTANTLADTLHKDGSFTYDNTTDALEAISDKVGTFSGDGGAAQDDSVKASLDLAHTDLDAIINKLATGVGVVQIATTTEDLNQAASTYDLLTGTTQPVILESLSLKMPAVDISGGALTYITIQTDDVTAQTIFNSTDGVKANLTSEAELSWTGCVRVNVGTKLTLTIAGGAAGTACAATITAQYRAVVAGGTLA